MSARSLVLFEGGGGRLAWLLVGDVLGRLAVLKAASAGFLSKPVLIEGGPDVGWGLWTVLLLGGDCSGLVIHSMLLPRGEVGGLVA